MALSKLYGTSGLVSKSVASSISSIIGNTNIQNNQSTNYKESNRKELLVKYISIIKKIFSDSNLEINTNEASSIACEIMNSTENPEKVCIDHNQAIKMAKELLNAKVENDNEINIILSEKKEISILTLEENIKKIEGFIQENNIKNGKEFLNNQNEVIDLGVQNINLKKMIEKNKENIERIRKEQEYSILELRKDLITYIMENNEIVLFISKNKEEWISFFTKKNIFRFFTKKNSETFNFSKKNLKKKTLNEKLESKYSNTYNGNTIFIDKNKYEIEIGYIETNDEYEEWEEMHYDIKESYYNLTTNVNDCFSAKVGILSKLAIVLKDVSYFYSFEEYKNIENSYENAEQVLNLLIKYDFVPLFQTSKWNFNETLKQKYLKLKEFYDTTKNIIDLKTNNINEIVEITNEKNPDYNFNYELLLKNYNLNSMETNLVDYYGNIKKWIDDLSEEVSNVTNVYKEVFSTINNYQTKQRNLSFTDNTAFEDRKTIFDRYLIGNPEEFYKTLFSIGEKAKDYELKLNDATNNFDFKVLTDLEREERPSFRLIAKNTGEQWNNYAKQLNEVSENLPRITKTIEIHEKEIRDWNLLLQRKENYLLKEDIDKSVLENWFNEWQEEYITLSKKVNNLLESYLRNVVDENSFIFILEELYNFRNNIDKLFEEEVIGAHYKFAFVPGGDLQESLERKSLKFKFIIHSIDNIEKLIFSIDSPITRRFLIKWNNMWFSNEIFENVNRFSSSDYDEVMIALNRDFIKMKEDNFKEFYNDVDAYINHKKEREKEYNSLIFKMRKEIAKQFANKQV